MDSVLNDGGAGAGLGVSRDSHPGGDSGRVQALSRMHWDCARAGLRGLLSKRWQIAAALSGSYFGHMFLSTLGLGPKASFCSLASVWAQKMCVLQLQGKRRALGRRQEAGSLDPCV